MIVAISGSQGSGKSTILQHLNSLGCNTVERKTSRSILSDWGVTLDDVNADPDLTIKFQAEISIRKYADEKKAMLSNKLWFTERTYADLFTYALVTLGKHNTYSDWLNDYYYQCIEYNQVYACVFYLRAGQFNVTHDGTRGSNHHYSRLVDLTMLDFTKQMTHISKLSIIETPDLEQRVGIIGAQSRALPIQ